MNTLYNFITLNYPNILRYIIHAIENTWLSSKRKKPRSVPYGTSCSKVGNMYSGYPSGFCGCSENRLHSLRSSLPQDIIYHQSK